MPRVKKYKSPDPLSCFNKYFVCNDCDKRLTTKMGLIRHLRICEKNLNDRLAKLTCAWCNVVFKNHANLASHALKLHSDSSYGSKNKREICEVCQKTFSHFFQLRYHIRKQHFNLKAKLPYCDQKKVNQVWFERVQNSNNVVEIRKTAPNILVMRRLDENTAIKVAEQETEEIDLTHVYPTDSRAETVKCKICSKKYVKRNLKKHMEEVHYNKMKYNCNNCTGKFKRLYQFLKHVCHLKRRKPRGIKQVSKNIIISSYESLAAVNG